MRIITLTAAAIAGFVLAAQAGIPGAGAGGAQAAATFALTPVQARDTAVTKQLVALGDSIFHGKAAGGICFVCHGPDAKGLPGLAPNLTDKTWLHGDGSLTFIVDLVTKGVPKPKQAAGPMLPKGGANLTTGQIRAVAAYVYSLSHK
jgi:mono/diheme cytochrome c family protein